MRDLRERLIMDDDNEEIQRKVFFRLLTGGKKENQYRVMLLPFFFTIAIGMISIPIIVILYRWVDLNITYLQDMEALIMASITLILEEEGPR
ncbi:MAG: hypothetical protein QCI82_12105 [Candidatus Thermoplasmatota archaeon]|nr:hypothetical protein [Candidatus Thermoplasmatota archaeon]